MKLRNKRTGEIKEFTLFDGYAMQGGATLAALVEEWEDYEESLPQIKRRWRNTKKSPETLCLDFETGEEAEKFSEKLGAWQRLRDKGFKPIRAGGRAIFQYAPDRLDRIMTAQESSDCRNDFDLLFGGEK